MSEPIIEEWESDSEDDEIMVKPKEVTKTVKPSFEKIESVNARNETVRQAENPRKNNKSPRGNKRNWNGMMTQKLGENFEFNNKACYVCGSFDHLHYTCKHKRKINDQKQVKPVWNNSKRVNHQNFGRFSHPNPKSNIVPQAVLTKSGLVSLNTAKSVSTAQSRKTMNDAMPTTYSYYKAYSSVKRPFNKKTTNYNRYFNKRVNTVKSTRVNTARPKAEVNTVKASASWVWKPKHEELDHVFKSNSASKTLTRYDYVDALGRKLGFFTNSKQKVQETQRVKKKVYNFYHSLEYKQGVSDKQQAKLVLPGIKVGAARQTFLLLVTITTVVNDEKQIHATVDSKAVVVIEASIRSSFLLNDADGTACLTNEAIFQNLALMGYEGELNKLTFQKSLFSPQWKYLIHTILHCLSLKSTSWNEFSTNIASAVICLATNQKFNFSKLIFDGMLRNLDTSKRKFLMYPRFLMVLLNNQIELGEPFNDVYVSPAHHNLNVFTNCLWDID
ncbi:hypothetical protein Tco_1247465 [Tanacetum coccineum]